MKQSSVIEDLQVVYELMERDSSKARLILGRIIYELQHEDVITVDYTILSRENRELRKEVKMLESEILDPEE